MNYSIKTLKNGFRSVAIERHHTDLCAVALLIRAGSRYDTQLKVPSGTAHFAEHLLFRSCTKMSSGEIYKTIESCGGKIDGGTTREYALIQVTVPSANIEKALEVIRNIVGYPSFNVTDLKDEIEIVDGEITREKDRFSVIWNLFYKNLWLKHPFRNSILGCEKETKTMALKDIRKFYSKCYCAKNMVLSIASGFEPDYIQNKVSKIFGRLRAGRRISPAVIKEPPQTKKRLEHLRRVLHQTHLIIGFKTCGHDLSDKYALRLIEIAFGGDGFSRLFRILREKKHWVYSFDVVSSILEDTGYFAIYSAVPPDKVDKVAAEILRQVNMIRKDGITSEELLYAKAQFKGNLLRKFESNLSIARIHGIETLLKGHYEPLGETIEKIEGVNKHDIVRAAKKYFHEKKAVIIAVGG